MSNFVDTIEDANGNQAKLKHSYENESGNVEISSSGTNTKGDPKKVNIVSVGDIQIKPGSDSVIQFDNESETIEKNKTEIGFKICNGSYEKANRVVRGKFNIAEAIIDTQNANSSEFNPEEFHFKFRKDKKDHPIYLKAHARAFDFRCEGHGGIALQIAGKDNSNHENKVKFESDRSNPITESTGQYNGEGGKGLEFGTFNNEHSSLFTKDYRFNKDGVVYAVTRETPVEVEGKFDYPTQADDFKDVLPNESVTFEDIINVVRYIKTLPEYNSWVENNPLTFE